MAMATALCSARAASTAGDLAALATSATGHSHHWQYGPLFPVAVEGVGGAGTLNEAARPVSPHHIGLGGWDRLLCPLTFGGVDCWGDGGFGQLGNGTLHSAGIALPGLRRRVGRHGAPNGVASLTSDWRLTTAPSSPPARSTVGGMAAMASSGTGRFTPPGRWQRHAGPGRRGGGTRAARWVANLMSDNPGSCALLTSGEVDCWGMGDHGELGNGTVYTRGTRAVPAGPARRGWRRRATLWGGEPGERWLSATAPSSPPAGSTAGGLAFSAPRERGLLQHRGTMGSSIAGPAVDGLGGTGTLTGVASLTSDGGSDCAHITSGGGRLLGGWLRLRRAREREFYSREWAAPRRSRWSGPWRDWASHWGRQPGERWQLWLLRSPQLGQRRLLGIWRLRATWERDLLPVG